MYKDLMQFQMMTNSNITNFSQNNLLNFVFINSKNIFLHSFTLLVYFVFTT